MSWLSPSPERTREIGAALGACVPEEGGVVALVGPLGAGKTVFAKGIARGLGLDPDALASPTFVIANAYPGRHHRELVHADFYRVEDADELESSGLVDWLAPGVVLVVEWGDRFREALPKDHLEVCIAPGEGACERRLDARAGGERASATLDRWITQCH